MQCYQCGCELPKDAVERRTVQSGFSVGVRLGSERIYYRKVNLCRSCAASHDENWAKYRRLQRKVYVLIGSIVFVLFWAILLLALFVK
jgi:hypothetical protein